MSLEDVKEDILRKAKAQGEAIKKQAEAEKARMIAQAKEEAASMKKEKDAALKKDADLAKKKTEAASELEQKKAVLTERKRIIDEVFELAMEKLAKLPKAEMKKKLEALQKKAASEISVGVVCCNKRDRDLVSGKTKEAKILGGLIAESADGSVSVDYSFETLLADIKEKHTEEISEKIFV